MGDRPLAKVTVTLLDSIKVKKYNDITIKDFFSSILKSQDLYTTDPAEYARSLTSVSVNKTLNNDLSPAQPKFLIASSEAATSLSDPKPSVTLIGNAMIASPETPNFGVYPARLKNYGSNLGAKDPIWKDAIVGDSDTRPYARMGNQLLGKNTGGSSAAPKDADGNDKDHIPDPITQQKLAIDADGNVDANGGSTASTNAWIPANDKLRVPSSFQEVLWEAGFGIRKYQTDEPESVITSEFRIQDMQPFSLRFKLGELNEAQRASLLIDTKASDATNKTNNTSNNDAVAAALANNAMSTAKGITAAIKNLQSSVDITWSSFKITYYQNGEIKFFYRGNELSSGSLAKFTQDDKYKGTQITVYPLGNYIYIYNGVPTTQATKNLQYKAYNMHTANYGWEGAITLAFKSGESFFNFSPVLHPKSGQIASPYFSGGFNADKKIFVLGYLGKFGVGARQSPITFPDSGDKDKLFGYLQKNKIEFTLTSSGALNSYALKLKVVDDNESLDSFTSSVRSAISTVANNIKTLQNEVKAAIATGDSAQVARANGQAQYDLGIPVADIGITTDADGNVIHVPPGATAPEGSNFTALPFDPTDGPRFSIATTFDDVLKAFSDLTDKGSHATTYINGVKGDLGNLTSSMFGFSGNIGDASSWVDKRGASLNDGVQRAQKQIQSTATGIYIKNINTNIYSPAVYYAQFILGKEAEDVSLSPDPQIDECDILDVSVNQSVEHSSATITLDNRVACATGGASKHGKYTYIKGQNNFTGVKPIRIEMGYESGGTAGGNTFGLMQSPVKTVFTGFVVKRDYDRSSPSRSTCTLTCEDMSKKAKEQFAVNLPFFDGWCSLAVIYYLAKQAGYDDSEILLSESPTGGGGVQIRGLLTGDPDTFTGGCFDGHANDRPTGFGGMSGSSLHRTLPLALVGVSEPNYNFSFGTSLWDCMNKVREFSQFYLYANNFGHLIYGPKTSIIKDNGFKFVEVDTASNFNEIQRRLDVSYDTSMCRNAVYLWGLTFLPNLDGIKPQWAPDIHIKKKKNFPNDIGDVSFCPWVRYLFIRDAKFENPMLTELAANEYLRRVTRDRAVADFGAWGNPALFPYDIVSIEESSNETGINAFSKVIIAAHTLHISSDDFQLYSDFSCETLDTGTLNYDNNLPLRE